MTFRLKQVRFFVKKTVDKSRYLVYNPNITMAEVAGDISTAPVWQLPLQERGSRRSFRSVPNEWILGLRRICAELSSEKMECRQGIR